MFIVQSKFQICLVYISLFLNFPFPFNKLLQLLCNQGSMDIHNYKEILLEKKTVISLFIMMSCIIKFKKREILKRKTKVVSKK